MSKIILPDNASAPSAPSAGNVIIYPRGGNWYQMGSDGVETSLGATVPASETTAGVAEIATQGETDAGTDDVKMVTPEKLANYSGLGGGVTDHGALTGLSDDDHTQYYNQSRGDARYVRITGDPDDGDWFSWDEASGTLVPEDAPSGGGGSLEAWQNVSSFSNSWVVSPFLRYRKDGDGLVTIQGAVASGTGTSNTVIFTMPVGYRIPTAANGLIFVGTARSSSGAAYTHAPLQVLDTGDVRVASGSSVGTNSLHLNITYYTDS
jgi:hypothetical protein